MTRGLRISRRATLTWLAVGLSGGLRPSFAQSAVELNLVLAIDASNSVSRRDFNFITNGLASAFSDRSVIEAVANLGGGLGVCAFQFAGLDRHYMALDWSRVHSAQECLALAGAFTRMPRPPRRGVTAIGNALGHATGLLRFSPFLAVRNVIDVSGDGRSNVGLPVTRMRDAAIDAGVTVNGLAITDEDRRLDEYYRQSVAGGAGAFVITTKHYRDFGEAIQRKLLREISGGAVS